MLRRLVTWCYDRRRRVVALWIVGLVGAVVLAGVAGGENDLDLTVDGSDSEDAVELLDERFPDYAGGTIDVVYASDRGVTSPEVAQRIDRLDEQLSGVDHVVATEAGPVSEDGTTALLQVRFDERNEDLSSATVEEVVDHALAANGDGLQVELGGFAVEQYERQEGNSESIGLLGAVVILLIAFGSAIAAGLPLLVAGFGLGAGLAGVSLLANVVDVADWVVQLAVMIGIGVGIDYALLIVTRYRSALAGGKEPRDAVIQAGTTAGRAVLYAGATAVVAIFGLVVIGTYYLGVAVAISLTIFSVVFASATVLPAVLGFAGRSIDRLRLPWHRIPTETDRGLAWRWSRVMQRRPLLAAGVSLGALLVLTAPALDLQIQQPDAGNSPTSMSSRRAYDLASAGFGPGFNGPLLVVADLEGTADPGTAADAIASAVESTSGVDAVLPPGVNDAGDTAVITAMPATSPQDKATQDLVRRLRDDVLPGAVADSGATVHVGGMTANYIDDADRNAKGLPWFIGGVIVLSVILLIAVFRSVPVALKAAVMNLLSIGAAYGIMAYAGEGGWFGELIGIGEATPVPAWLPAMMFAVLFGLSMDYEVFLLSRIREEHARTGDTSLAVADGLAKTARVITAAAAIMVVVASSFILEDLVMLKLAGLGLASAIFVDATIVRMILVPSAMELLGERNWWMPRWLDRILPHLDMAGTEADAAAPPGSDTDTDTEQELTPVAAD